MRHFYTTLFYLILPFIFARLYWRSIKAPAYRLRWRERLGYYQQPALKQAIWIHAVSVGEAEAVFPLVKHMQAAYPTHAFLITTTTPTGSARVNAVLGETVTHVYLPYDTLGAVRRFFEHFQPKIAIIMETEIWPNLFAACGERQIPLFMINACLSEKSTRGYQKLPQLVRQTLAHVTTIAAQTETDRQRFLTIGATAEQVQVCGNIKFDTPPQDEQIATGQQLRKRLFPGRFVWMIASTHLDEEAYFLPIYTKLKVIAPELLLLIAPRHPERFHEVQKLCLKYSLKVIMRTAQTACDGTTDIYIIDTLGELKMLYATADLAFVGGSLVPIGGHNILEPATVNVPIMFGPYMDNVRLVAQGLLKVHAAMQCSDGAELVVGFTRLYADGALRLAMVANAQQFVLQNRGAADRILGLLSQKI